MVQRGLNVMVQVGSILVLAPALCNLMVIAIDSSVSNVNGGLDVVNVKYSNMLCGSFFGMFRELLYFINCFWLYYK